MRRSTICSLILALLIAAVAQAAPLTHEEALTKIEEWGPDKTADKIVVLDTILQATQENGGVTIRMPSTAFFVLGRDVSLAWQGPIVLGISGYIHAEIFPPEIIGRHVVPGPSLPDWAWAALIVGGFVIGAVAGNAL